MLKRHTRLKKLIFSRFFNSSLNLFKLWQFLTDTGRFEDFEDFDFGKRNLLPSLKLDGIGFPLNKIT